MSKEELYDRFETFSELFFAAEYGSEDEAYWKTRRDLALAYYQRTK